MKNNRPFGLRDKVGYLLGDFGNDFSFLLVSAFLMVFYTDVLGISAAQVGTLFLVARFWDAITDVIWGRFIDSRKRGKMGKFRPWIFRMSFPLVVVNALLFLEIPGMADGFYLAYAYVLIFCGEFSIQRLTFRMVQWLLLFLEMLLTEQLYPLGGPWVRCLRV